MKTIAGLAVLLLLIAAGIIISATVLALAISGVEHYVELVTALAHHLGAH